MYKLILAGLVTLALSATGAEKVSFSDQIRPLLNRNCTGCHGGVKQAGGFSLLYKERAFGKTHHGVGIVPGKPEESMLYKVITSPPEIFDHNRKKNRRLEHMPMEKEPLSAEEIALIKRWIEEGAEWEEHWAYNAPKKHELPKVNSKWPSNRIDYFTLNKLNELQVSPAPEAAREILLRRVYLDIIGLPPTPEEVKEFVDDKSENAYEKVVDKLLSSQAYGEKWAGMWLDLARYADTQGYEKDNFRTIYRFRDEVIKAFNNDTPYDQFVIEQMAGDLIPNATEHQKILTAFHRNTMTNTEGGTSDEEFRVAAVIDRVNTTWEVFLGSSFGCVQCHTHPYDPFTHKEYFQFMSFLNNTADSDKNNEAPFIQTPDIYQQKQLDEWKVKLADLRQKLDLKEREVNKNFAKNYNDIKSKITHPETKALTGLELESSAGNKLTVDANGVLSSTKSDKDKAVFTISGTPGIDLLDYIQIEALPEGNFGQANNFVLSKISAKVIHENKKPTAVNFSHAKATFEQKGFPAKDALDKNKDKGWALAGAPKKTQTAWFFLKKPLKLKPADKIELTLSFESKHKQHIMKKFTIKTGKGKIDPDAVKFAAFMNKEASQLNKKEKEVATKLIISQSDSGKLYKEIANFENKIKSLKIATTPIMEELPKEKRRKTHIFIRGNWEDLAEEVTEGTPEIMNKFKPEWPKNRLGMSYWLTSKENPLFSRVAVNRFWEQIFGLGIVETLEDFGSQGIKPTHPKLLDDLAYRFAHEHKWSIKSLIKEIVLSSTYRQSSDVTPEKLEKDPFNHYLTRGPRFRLSAEQIRDQALKVSGLMSSKMFGPSVMPYQPEGVWMTVYNGRKWVTSKNGDQHRRALYTFWKRTSPYPSMEAFDTPSREVCKVRRVRTNTPLQALVTLNDPVYMECAEELGKKIKNHSGSLEEKLTFAFQKALCRSPKKTELVPLKSLYNELQRDYGKNESESWTLVANVIMNLDEFLIKR